MEIEIAELTYANKVGYMKVHSAQKHARLLQLPLEEMTEMLNDALKGEFGQGPTARITAIDLENNRINFTTKPVEVPHEWAKEDYLQQIISRGVSILHGFEMACLFGTEKDFDFESGKENMSFGLILRDRECDCDMDNVMAFFAALDDEGIQIHHEGGGSTSIKFDKDPEQVAEATYKLLESAHKRFNH